MELFDTFYDDYIEHKLYINEILKIFPVSEDVVNEQWETSKCETSCKERIKSLENKINIPQTENKRLVEEYTNYMKIIELLSVGNQNKTTEKNNINEKSSNHIQSEYQYQNHYKKQQHGSKQHQGRQQELQRKRQ